MGNGEWRLLGITFISSFANYSCCPDDKYFRINYTIHLKRRPFYYFFNLIVPCGLIGFLAILGFTLPPESGEKLTLGATLLFSLIVFLNMISESMPANSDTVPLLGTIITSVIFDCRIPEFLFNRCQEPTSTVSCSQLLCRSFRLLSLMSI